MGLFKTTEKDIEKWIIKKNVKMLIKALNNTDTKIRDKSLVALIDYGIFMDSYGFNFLLTELNKSYCVHKHEICEKIAEALVKFGDIAVEPLIKLIEIKKFSARYYILKVLGNIGNHSAIEPLIKVLNDHDEKLGNEALQSLIKFGVKAVEPLIRSLKNGNYSAIKVLAELGDPKAVEPIIEFMKNSESYKKLGAIEALGKLGDHRAIKPIIEFSKKSEGYDKLKAIEALANFNDKKAFEEVNSNFYHYYYDKSYAAKGLKAIIQSMIKFGYSRINEDIIKVLEHKEYSVKEIAAEAIGKMHNPPIKSLIEILNSDSNSKEYVVQALCKISDPIVFEPLVEALKISGGEIRGKAVEALGKLGDPRAIEPLILTIADISPSIRIKAAEALHKLGDSYWVSIIKGEEDDFVHLAKINDQRLIPQLQFYKNHIIDKIKNLCNGYGNWDSRSDEAIKVFGIIKNNFSLFAKDWDAIHKTLTTKHIDNRTGSTNGAYGDCNHDDTRKHVDTGIGLTFTEK